MTHGLGSLAGAAAGGMGVCSTDSTADGVLVNASQFASFNIAAAFRVRSPKRLLQTSATVTPGISAQRGTQRTCPSAQRNPRTIVLPRAHESMAPLCADLMAQRPHGVAGAGVCGGGLQVSGGRAGGRAVASVRHVSSPSAVPAPETGPVPRLPPLPPQLENPV